MSPRSGARWLWALGPGCIADWIRCENEGTPATWSSDPFSGVTSAATVLLDGFHRTTVALSLANNGQGYWGMSRNNTQIQADPTFPGSTPVLTMGKASGMFGTRVKDLAIDCNNVTGSVGFLLNGCQEGSGLDRVQSLNALDAAVRLSTSNTQNITCYDVDCSTGAAAGSIGIDIAAGVSGFIGFTHVSNGGNAGTPAGTYSVTITATGGSIAHTATPNHPATQRSWNAEEGPMASPIISIIDFSELGDRDVQRQTLV